MLFFGGNFGRDKRLLAHFTGRVLPRADHVFLRIAYLGWEPLQTKTKK